MENSGLDSNSILNATAVWFIVKAIEVISFAIYDTIGAARRWVRENIKPDSTSPETRYDIPRFRMEYVLSGAGFLNIGLFRQKRTLLLLIATAVPLIVFILEVMSIILGNERRKCITSSDLNVIKSPALVLFGDGERHGNLSTTLEEIGFGAPAGLEHPCIRWSSRHAGIEFLSFICVDLVDGFNVAVTSEIENLFSSTPLFLVLIRKVPISRYLFTLNAILGQVEPVVLTLLSTVSFYSKVVVNGKDFLYQDAAYTREIQKEKIEQFRRDVRFFENGAGAGRVNGTYLENDKFFGYGWLTADDYKVGITAMAYAVFAQATREPINTAANMSNLNRLDKPRTFDVSCEEGFRIPRTASVIIIAVAVVVRLMLLFIPSSKSTVELLLEESEETLLGRS